MGAKGGSTIAIGAGHNGTTGLCGAAEIEVEVLSSDVFIGVLDPPTPPVLPHLSRDFLSAWILHLLSVYLVIVFRLLGSTISFPSLLCFLSARPYK